MIQLIITISDEGKLSVQGPINDKIQAYGLLAIAQDAIREHHEQNKSLIQVPTFTPPKFPVPGS